VARWLLELPACGQKATFTGHSRPKRGGASRSG